MKKLNLLLLMMMPGLLYAQSGKIPVWFTEAMTKNRLGSKYQLKSFLKKPFIVADFNGDGNDDVAALIIERNTLKTGILLIHNRSNQYFIIGAGTKFGKIGFDAFDNLKWVHDWKVNRDKFTYETIFKNGDIEGSRKVALKRPGISLWDDLDGAPNAGGTIIGREQNISGYTKVNNKALRNHLSLL